MTGFTHFLHTHWNGRARVFAFCHAVSPLKIQRRSVVSSFRRRVSNVDQLGLQFRPTVGAYVAEFMRQSVAKRHKPSYLAEKRRVLSAYIIPLLGNVCIGDIDKRHVLALMESLDGLSNKTVNNVMGVFRSLLLCAKGDGLISGVPEIKDVPSMIPAVDFYSFEEYSRLAHTAKRFGAKTLAVLFLCGDSGLRKGEALGLQWNDIDLDGAMLTVRRSVWCGQVIDPKNYKSRTIPMTPRLVEALKAISRVSEWVFANEAGERVTSSAFYKWMERLIQATGIRRKGMLHILRHTFCTHLAMLGAPSRVIKELAGHCSIAVTERYMHLTDEDKAKAISLLSKKTEAQGLLPGRSVLSAGVSAGSPGNKLLKDVGETGIEPVTHAPLAKSRLKGKL